MFTNFHAAVPPNAPSCSRAGGDNTWDYEQPAIIIAATSNHTGGVNVGLVDGSVQFASDTIQCRTSHRLGEDPSGPPAALGAGDSAGMGHMWNGPSTIGVWGSLATPASAESNTSF
jgi:prepilin-type processing-associated H-X9-DG protein